MKRTRREKPWMERGRRYACWFTWKYADDPTVYSVEFFTWRELVQGLMTMGRLSHYDNVVILNVFAAKGE